MPELTVNGVAVPYQRRGAGAPLLALHAEDAAGEWRPLHEALAAHLDVVLPVHPGFGETERPEWLDTILDLACCHLEVLDQLGLREVHLLGESLGGWVAAEMAALAPERFTSLTLLGPMGLRVANMPDLFVMNRIRWREITRLHPPEPEPEPSVDVLIKESRVQATLARIGWNPYLHDPRLPRWLHRATMPALVIWGAEDRLIPASTAELWRRTLPAAHVELVGEAGHFPGLEQPRQTARAILDFVGGGPRPRPSQGGA